MKTSWSHRKLPASQMLKNDAGFTLIELSLAIGVVAIALVLLIGSLFSIVTATELSESRAIAAAHQASVIEEIHASPDIFEYQPPVMRGLGASEIITAECFDQLGVAFDLPVDLDAAATVFPNPLEIRVTVSWIDRRGRVITVSTTTNHGRL